MKEIEILGNKIKYKRGVFTIIDSYKINDRKEMIKIINKFFWATKTYSIRNNKSLIREWKAHNRLYKLGLFRKHTKDCDFEDNEKKLRLFIYFFIGI